MGAYDVLKDAAVIFRDAGKIPEYAQILETLQQLTDQQKKIIDLEAENRALKETLERKKGLVFDKSRNSYWSKTEEGEDGPFCSRCNDCDDKAVRMLPCGNPDYSECPQCKNSRLINPRGGGAPGGRAHTASYR